MSKQRVGIYCRLSRDDDTLGESVSITNQKNILSDYVKEKNWILVDTYVDDGYSGTNFDRPEFIRMIQDIKDKKIDCVLVKDQSRLGRNYIEVGNYTEYYFPTRNVRYIALSDGIDSFKNEDMDIAPFKNIMNEFYAKDTSKKIKTALRSIAKNGGYLTAIPPYGYVKDPQDHLKLIIDQEYQEVVKRIFALSEQGYGGIKIAKILRDDRIVCPSYLAYERYGGYKHLYQNQDELRKYEWNPEYIRDMVKNEVYAGHSVMFKTGNLSYKIKKRIRKKDSEKVIVRNTHEAIIDQDQFDRVQVIVSSRSHRVKRGDTASLFSQVLKCSTCGRTLTYNSRDHYYMCPLAKLKGTEYCGRHYINENALKEIVLKQLQGIIRVTIDDSRRFSELMVNKLDKDKTTLISRYLRLKQEYEYKLKESDNKLTRIYDDYYEQKINDRMFETLTNKLTQDQERYLKEIKKANEILEQQDQHSKNVEKWIELVEKYKNIEEFNFEVVHKLIEKIIVHEKEIDALGQATQRLEIYYTFIGQVDSR